MAMNNDNLPAGESVTREEHDRVISEYRLAHNMVIRGDEPDLDTALATVRSA